MHKFNNIHTSKIYIYIYINQILFFYYLIRLYIKTCIYIYIYIFYLHFTTPNLLELFLFYLFYCLYSDLSIYIDVVRSVALSNDGKYLATGSRDNMVNLINIQSKMIYHKFDNLHTGNNIYIYIYNILFLMN